jgi:hypothetical protein
MLNRNLSVISLVVVIASITFFGMSTWLLATWQMAELDGAFALIGCLIAAILFAFRFFDPADFEPLSIVAAVEPKTKVVSPRGNTWTFEKRPLTA